MSGIEDAIFARPVVIAVLGLTLLFALLPKDEWLPWDYALALACWVFLAGLIGGGQVILSFAREQSIAVLAAPIVLLLYSVVCMAATAAAYWVSRRVLEVIWRVPRDRATGIPAVGGVAVVFGYASLALPFVSLGFMLFATRTEAGFRALLLAGLAGAVLLGFAFAHRGEGTPAHVRFIAGLVVFSGAILAGPSAFFGHQMRDGLASLPVYQGSTSVGTKLWTAGGEAKGTWTVNAPIADVARYYDKALQEQGWRRTEWGRALVVGMGDGLRGEFCRTEPLDFVEINVFGSEFRPPLPNDSGLEALLTRFAPGAAPLRIETSLNRPESPEQRCGASPISR